MAENLAGKLGHHCLKEKLILSFLPFRFSKIAPFSKTIFNLIKKNFS